jgi:hypothetical protein
MAFNPVLTNVGKGLIPNYLAANAGYVVPKYIGWGTGAGSAAATDTTLFTESADESRVAGTVSAVTTTNPGDTIQITGTMTCATNAKTITNAGVLDAATSGRLFIHADFTGVALNIGDSLAFTFKLQFP